MKTVIINRVLFSSVLILLCIVDSAAKYSNLTFDSKSIPTEEQNARERVFLHTDRDSYVPGDTIRIRAFLFDADKSLLADYSRYIYVDLVNSRGVILGREKIAYDTNKAIFDGYYPLSSVLKSGEYELRAYTYWMQNEGVGSFFSKPINLGYSEPLSTATTKDNNKKLIMQTQAVDNNSTRITLSIPATVGINYANLSVSVVYGNYVSANTTDIVSYINSEPANHADSVSDDFYMERGVVLSGYITNRKGDVVPNSKIAFIGEDNTLYYAYTDLYGHVECPVMWDSKCRFYTQNASNKKDVWFNFKKPRFLTHVSYTVLSFNFQQEMEKRNNPYGWTDNEVVVEKYPMPLKAETPVMTAGSGNGGPTGYSAPNPGMRTKTSDAFQNHSLNPYSNTPVKMVVKKKRKTNIRRLDYWAPQRKVELGASGATAYWNPEAIVRPGVPFEFTIPVGADSRIYTVIVNGVDNNGKPIGGIWRVD